MTNQKSIWQASLQLITRRSHSEYELQQKLYYKDYSYESVENVIQRLREYGYINDDELAKNLFNKYLQAGKYSLKQITFKMKQRGIPDAIIHNIISTCDKEEWQSALKLVNIRFKTVDVTIKEKIYRYLATKGFSSTSISKVMQHLYQFENNF